MYKEEKMINGVLHYRNDPDNDFKPYSAEELTQKLMKMRDKYNKRDHETEFQWACRIIYSETTSGLTVKD